VIDIDQDPLGKQAKILRHTPQEFVLAKPMADGSVAIGLFNLSSAPLTMSVDWKDIGLGSHAKVRDVWYQKNLGRFSNGFSSQVAPHDVFLIRVQK
jgi:alpha-galactosidase